MKVIAQNRRGYHDYTFTQTLEGGIVLTGKEIKAVRAGKVQLQGSYVKILSGDCYWVGGIIQSGDDEQRTRKVLLHKKQIQSLIGTLEQKSVTVIPLKLYLKRNYAKLEIGIGTGKKVYDKRETIKKHDIERGLREGGI